MKTLTEIYELYSGRKGDIGEGFGDKGTQHTYIQNVYSQYFQYGDTVNILEIGVCKGHSHALWLDFFSEDSTVVGIDISIGDLSFDLSKCVLIQANSLSSEALKQTPKIDYDFIIDDGSHRMEEQLKNFEIYFPLLRDGGVYFIEDINVGLYGESIKSKIKELHGNVEIIDNRHNTKCQDVIAIITK